MKNNDKNNKSVFSRILSSFKNMFVLLFGFGKHKQPIFDENAILSPRKVAIQNFKRNRLAMGGLILFITMTITIIIGSSIVPMELHGTETILKNLAPNRSYLKVPKGLKNVGVEKISTGIDFSVGLDTEGKIYVWGSKSNGVKNIPDEVKDIKIKDVSAGDRHIIAIGEDNKIYAWGLNSFNQAEVPMSLNSILMMKTPKEVYADNLYSAVLTEDNFLYIWGSTLSSGMDIVGTKDQGNVQKIATSASNTILLRTDGQVSYVGQRGTQLATLPEELSDGSHTYIDIAAGQEYGLALDSEGKLHAWGARDANGLATVPEALQDLKFTSISGGRFNFTAIEENGQVHTWGSNKFSQATLPKALEGKDVKTVNSSFYQNYAIGEDGSVTSWGHKGFMFGSDDYGRDLGTRLLHGGLITMFIGAIAVLISTVIGVTVGLISGFYGGVIDNVLMRMAEIVNSFPFLPLAITLSTIVTGTLSQAQKLAMIMVILGVLSWPGLARLVRGQILAEREKDFVLAARALGLPNKTIIMKHILPSVVNIIIVSMTLSYAGSLLTESGLSFLGFGVSAPSASWGNMLIGSQDSKVIEVYWWRWLFPALAVLMAALSVNLVGDGLREALDPKSNEK